MRPHLFACAKSELVFVNINMAKYNFFLKIKLGIQKCRYTLFLVCHNNCHNQLITLTILVDEIDEHCEYSFIDILKNH